MSKLPQRDIVSHAGVRQGKHPVASQAPGTGGPEEKEGGALNVYFTEEVTVESM